MGHDDKIPAHLPDNAWIIILPFLSSIMFVNLVLYRDVGKSLKIGCRPKLFIRWVTLQTAAYPSPENSGLNRRGRDVVA